MYKETLFTIHVTPNKESMESFLNWQTRYNEIVAANPGFISIEITLSAENKDEWLITERFENPEALKKWQQSPQCTALVEELNQYADTKNIGSKTREIDTGITEVIVTEVTPGKETEFREWMAKIHQVEARFPGFRGAYVQSPISSNSRNWITLLQFDTIDNLNNWISSKERAAVIKESEGFVTSFDNHRVTSPYAGWFASVSKEGQAPSAWKQAMIVLLILYPIVMLEMLFLNPLLKGLSLAPSVFIGNAISVSLVTAIMPIAILFLGWWLKKTSPIGTLLVLFLYFLEVMAFQLS